MDQPPILKNGRLIETIDSVSCYKVIHCFAYERIPKKICGSHEFYQGFYELKDDSGKKMFAIIHSERNHKGEKFKFARLGENIFDAFCPFDD